MRHWTDARLVRDAIRLRCPEVYVDLRLVGVDGRWMAVADTPDGPSIGWGHLPLNAAIMALQPFDHYLEELLLSVSRREAPDGG